MLTATLPLIAALLAAPAPSVAPTATTPTPKPPPARAPASGDPEPSTTGAPAPAEPEDEGGSNVTRYSFTGLDIDGELRTPALLQFLARIAGEFETVGIPHRSFMPELSATLSEDSL